MQRPNWSQYPDESVFKRVQQSLLYLLLLFVLLILTIGLYKGGVKIIELRAEQISYTELPYALFLSFIRMLVAYVIALSFAFVAGLLAARTSIGERVIIPFLDILQSVPIVGFFPAAMTFFISVTHGHRIGVEVAAVFLIFTSQAWNMAFAIYESIKSIPQDDVDAIESFGMRGSKKFWKLYAPTCVPRLVYNSILSWSNGWFFLVACEIIAVGPIRYNLPGIGSFLARAAENDEIKIVFVGLLALTSLILFMDIAVWRPISVWSSRFKHDLVSADDQQPLFPSVAQKLLDFIWPLFEVGKKLIKVVFYPIVWILREVLFPVFWDLPLYFIQKTGRTLSQQKPIQKISARLESETSWSTSMITWIGFVLIFLLLMLPIAKWLVPPYPAHLKQIPMAILVSTGRVSVALILSLLWTLPLVLWTWNKPKLRRFLTTIAQVGASLPAIALFPLIILIIVGKVGGGMEMASILLLMTGMQWYVLFNCLAGASSIPQDISQVVKSLGLSKTQTWKKLVIPALRPSLITGLLTAWGGGWNALVVAEYVVHKEEVLAVRGIGSLLNYAVYESGNTQLIVFCIIAMVAWIVLWNLVFWHPVYQSSIERYKFDH